MLIATVMAALMAAVTSAPVSCDWVHVKTDQPQKAVLPKMAVPMKILCMVMSCMDRNLVRIAVVAKGEVH